MNENVYMLPDGDICRRIGLKMKEVRLRQNLTQMELAGQAQISLSSVKKIEQGQIGKFDSLLRVMRILGELDILSPLLCEEELSPNEYLEYVEKARKKRRRRATSSSNDSLKPNLKSEW